MMVNKFKMVTAEEIANQMNIVSPVDNLHMIQTIKEHQNILKEVKKEIEAKQKEPAQITQFRLPKTTEIVTPNNPEVKKKEEKRAKVIEKINCKYKKQYTPVIFQQNEELKNDEADQKHVSVGMSKF